MTNADPSSLDVVEKSIGPVLAVSKRWPLGLSWPRDVFSLSHVAIPFPPSDLAYGREDIFESIAAAASVS